MKKVFIVLTAALLACLMYVGCAPATYPAEEVAYSEMEYAKADMAAAEEPRAEEAAVYEEEMIEEAAGASLNDGNEVVLPQTNRKIIHSATIGTKTKNFDDDYDKIIGKLEAVGGYIESADVSGNKPENWQDEGRRAYLVLRVPKEKYNEFLNVMEGVGEVVSKNISGQDITGQYFDTESRIRVLKIRLERLESLLTDSQSLEHIIELEREISDVMYELDSYEGQRRSWDNLIDYTSVTVMLQEVHEIARVTPAKQDLGTRITNGWYTVINALADFFKGFVVVFIAALPILAILGVLAVIVIVIVKASKKRKAKKRANLEKKE